MTIFITGANRGIGFELVKQYLSLGHQVFASCRQPQQAVALTQLQQQLKQSSKTSNLTEPKKAIQAQLTILQLDVNNEQDINALFKLFARKPIDKLINNAAVFEPNNVNKQSIIPSQQAWLQRFATNCIGPMMLAQALLPALRLSNHPKIINLSSIKGALNRQTSGYYAYRSSKAALNKATQLLALELKDENIIVCPLHPGWVKNDMGGDLAEIEVCDSVSAMINVIDKLTMKESGLFFNYRGERLDW